MTSIDLVNMATGEVVPERFDMQTFLAQLATPAAMAAQQDLMRAYDAACHALLGPNDSQQDGGRTFKKKSAWRKLARYFNISVHCDPKDVRVVPGVDEGDWLVYTSATATAPWGQSWTDVGACGSDEESGRRTLTYADAMATAMTRASNRAVSNLIAMGEVSADELSTKAARPTVPKARSASAARAPSTTTASDVPPCPACLGSMWDNRAKKRSGEFKAASADFVCRDKACGASLNEADLVAGHA